MKQDVFLEDSLSIDDKNFLHNHDYVLGSFHNLKKGKQKQYFVKKKGNEGAPHTFYVDLIYKEIKKYTNDVNKYVAENADIIFINWRGEEVAIEVETGMKAKYKSTKDYHDEKFEARRKQFGDKCYIFLIQSKIKNSYLRHNLPILYRSKIKKLVLSEFDNYGKSTSGGKSDSTK